MSEQRAHTRVDVKHGATYLCLETAEEIADMMMAGDPTRNPARNMCRLTSVQGQDLFPPEELYVRASDILVVQVISDESWIWIERMQELGYARQMADLEQSPQERLAEVQERMVDVLAGKDDDE